MNKEIRLDDQWVVIGKDWNWELKQYVEKTREKKNGEKENYLAEDSWYYPTIKMCLNRYMKEALKPLPTIGVIILKLDEIDNTIKNLKVK